MNREGMNKDFFYMYNFLFCDLRVKVLFDDFIMSMFWILDIASMQLHPNRWAAIQVFRALCFNSYVLATPRLFLHYFYSRPQDKAQWISLIWIPKHPLFHPFTSYKNFKTGYFKVTIRPVVGKNHFYDSVGNPLFPFYWQQCPRWYEKYPKELLSPNNCRDLKFLKMLPR